MRPFVSVIVPAYNEARYIEEQLEALKAQKYNGRWEIIVVNNRSTDNTAQIVEKYKNRIANLQLIDAAEKQGRSYARNVGAKYAKGDALLFCDAHTVVERDWLPIMADALSEHDIVAGGLDVQKLNKARAWNQPLFHGSEHKFMGFLPLVVSANIGISRAAFEAVGGFCEEVAIGEDADLSFRLQLKGYTIHDAFNAVVYVRYRETVLGMWKQTVKFTEAHVYLYKKYAIHGYKRRGIKEAWPLYKWLIKYAMWLFVGPPQERQKWIRTCAACWGRIQGSWKYRVLYL
jgi:glycosyltransferase involved in cell wall biosynthesis